MLEKPTMAKRRVALMIEWSREYGRGILRGIASHVRTHGNWKIFHAERRLCDGVPSWLRNWRGDGIIARIENQALLTQVKKMKLPTVNLYDCDEMPGMARILTGEADVGRMAAEHLLERKLEHFAYCGLPGLPPSDLRGKYFIEHLASAGYYDVYQYENPCHSHTSYISSTEEYELLCEDALTDWIGSLPKPVGLMACNDVRAHQVLMSCGENGIAVPDEVAVIGVDNDEMVCEICQPSLSSIELDSQQVGFEAAVLLDRMMDGEPLPKEATIIKPLRVVPRQSTDVLAVTDADIAAAVHFIREHACEGICVSDILGQVHLSRSTLERRFVKALSRSAKAEIVRVQLDRVKQLLAETNYPLAKVA
ncbi:MAG: DNA-binding transcriptional regulator, partial [Planctomycetota bacterium]|nr:DNA-binding transcriptional regulator [Planctomycetota bacterium]